MRHFLGDLCGKMSRKKHLSTMSEDTKLKRCLGICDLIFLGIGSMVGSGIYVLVGIAAKLHAGPSIVISFVLAAVTILLAAWCYTEFASRVPRTGSAYLFTYICLGEFVAFQLGWMSLFMTVNGVATNARAWSAYFNALLKNTVSNYTKIYVADWSHVGEPITDYPDFVACIVIIIITIIVAMGVQCTAKFTSVFASFNIAVLLFASIVGYVYADTKNWTEGGGFIPYGWSGMVSGAGACFWAFTGFEVISISCEETKNPRRAIPISMLISLGSVLLLYLITSSSLTLLCNYNDLEIEAPLPSAFAQRGLTWAYYIVSIGPLCGLTTSLFSTLYGFVRLAYAMASDGMIFSVFSNINDHSKVPVYNTIIGGILSAIQAMFFDLRNIVSFGIVLSLLTYIIIDFCVIILRYRPQHNCNNMPHFPLNDDDSMCLNWKIKKFKETSLNGNLSGSMTNLLDESDTQHVPSDNESNTDTLDNLDSISQHSEENHSHDFAGQLKPACSCLERILRCSPGCWVYIATVLCCILLSVISLLLFHTSHWYTQGVAVSVLVIVTVLLLGSIVAHRQNTQGLVIKVPFVPWLPILSIFSCLLLLVSTATPSSWIGVLVLTVTGQGYISVSLFELWFIVMFFVAIMFSTYLFISYKKHC